MKLKKIMLLEAEERTNEDDSYSEFISSFDDTASYHTAKYEDENLEYQRLDDIIQVEDESQSWLATCLCSCIFCCIMCRNCCFHEEN